MSIQHIVNNTRNHVLILMLISSPLYGQIKSTDETIGLRSDPQSPITQDEIANAKKDLSTPKFIYNDFYIGPEIGASILMDVTVNLNTPVGSAEGTVEANTGVRLDIPTGYVVSDFFAFEFAPGIIYNGLSTFESVAVDGYILQVPLMVNMIWSFNTDKIRFGKSCIRPYIGGGVGAVFSFVNVDSIAGVSSLSGYTVSQDSNTWTLGYQGIAGLDYDFDEETSFGIRYAFTGTSNQTFSGNGNSLSTGGLLSQNILLRFIHRF